MKLDILTQTDFAGAIEATYHCPGAAKVAGLIRQVRSENPEGTLVLDAGDVLCAAPVVNLTDGTPVIRVLNSLGLDAMTLGNHEFDNGPEAMDHALGVAEFPILCANIRSRATGKTVAKPWVILERQGVKIGVVGVTTEYTPFMLRADRFEEYIMEPPVQALQTWIPYLRQRCQVVVVLSHLPGTVEPDGSCTGELFEVMDRCPGADVYIGGHNFGFLGVIRDGAAVVKAGFSACHMARVTLTLDETGQVTGKTIRIYDMMAEDFAPVLEVQRQVEEIMAPFWPLLKEPLAELPIRLDVNANGECPLGNFYTDGLRCAAGGQVGLFNATSIYGFMSAGTVTGEMLRHVMCFDEAVFRGTMTGAQLRALLERTYEEEHWAMNRALHFTGLRVVVDTRNPLGSRVVSLQDEQGRDIRDTDTFLVGTTDYIASGGNDYREIMEKVTWEDTGVMTHSFYTEFLRSRGRIPHETDGRLVNLDPGWPR